MSRFGLRSCADGFKLLEDKNNRSKGSNPTSISSKRSVSQKESKFSIHINNNDENLINEIKVESDEIENGSDKLTKSKISEIVGEDDDDGGDADNDNDNDNDHDEEDNYIQRSPVCKGTLVCSLPLDRINEIIQKLNLNKTKVEKEKETEGIMIEETLDNDDDEEDDVNISKQSQSNIKNLCLYCDRKFSSHKMQIKHVDKFHCLQQDRRCSGRNAQVQQHQQSQSILRKRKSAVATQSFPGCNFCQKPKGQSQPVILPATELSSLFLHLTDCHTDKYFGCKTCVIRFQNISKLSKHMETVHKSLPFAFDENSSKSRDNDTDSLISIEKIMTGERGKLSSKRQQRSQKSLNCSMSLSGSSLGTVSSTSQCSTAIVPNTSVIGAEEPILSRLGLTQNRLPNNRKGVRLRREKLLPELLLKSEQNHTSSTNFSFGQTTSLPASSTISSTSTSTCSPKLRGKSLKLISGFSGDTTVDAVFRVPTRNDMLSCVFDDNFYKEVVSNVRNNLLFHLDGKIMGDSMQELDTSVMRHTHQPQIRSTLVKSPIVVTAMDSEIHAATSLAAITAFPTLLTAEQFGGDGISAKIRRPHTKNSWKWKWDSVKKFKLINEGGKIVKKMKHPMLGLRDLSKLDMWTQLTMRQKHELQQQQKINLTVDRDNHWHHTTTSTEISADPSREEKQRLNDQLNFILDMRLLPHIILEQNEQAIIKLENDEFGISPPIEIVNEDCGDNFMAQTFADEGFLSMLNLLPNYDIQNTRTRLVLSGEWARPRCYLCICCGAKFEKLKSLEEHKMFRHSQILSTYYEVVGRELLNGNLLRHLFIPKKALSRYGNESDNTLIYSGAARRLFWHKNEILFREITNNEESSDSLQSVLHSCATNSPSLKNSSSSTEDCDIDLKLSTAVSLQLIGNSTVVSPTHSMQSCSSSSSTGTKSNLKLPICSRSLPLANRNAASCSTSNTNIIGSNCSKCGRKSNGVLDLYRHMLDCSGDYIWTLAKKRKYRYYCGSKKRRPCNKHSILELRKNKGKTSSKSLSISNDNTTEEGAVSTSNFTKTKSSPRSRPSDAESIKKMLENLPPKRVCKKIFPTLSKTKKSIKNKIYNSLRKTRVRQMSQAAKILSKTKSQLKNPKKITTRSSSSAISTKVAKNQNNKTTKTIIKKAMKKSSSLVKRIQNSSSSTDNSNTRKLEKFPDEVDYCNIKTEDKIAIEIFNSIKPTEEIELSGEILNSSSDLLISDNSKDKSEQLSQGEKSNKTLNANNTVAKQTKDTIEIEKEVPQQNHEKNGKIVPSNTINVTSDFERNTQTNTKNVKRSKRISDCIAMLTGKLEEKLKTEQKTLVPTTPEKIPISDITHPITPFIPPNTPMPFQPPTTLILSKSSEDAEKSSSKKIPKRKTICRRIIKSNVSESGQISVFNTNIENKINDKTKCTNSIDISTSSKELSLEKPLTAQPISSTKQSVVKITSFPKNLTEQVFSQVENKRPTNFISKTVLSSMPPPTALIPKLPLFLPMDNVRQPMATPQITTMGIPMPNLPLPVPVSIQMENVSQTSPDLIKTVAATASKMIPTPVIPIMTAVPAHLSVPPPPGLQLTLSSFNTTNAAAEPLNLSNSSKNVQKQSQDLSCSGNQRLSGIPARRQTICGFEVRNFAMYDEMEPLDLSKKTRPENAFPTASFPLRHIEMAPLLLPPQAQVLGLPNESTVLTMPPLTPEALLNKPFYSNLDLLRIPQVRNPIPGQVAVVTNESLQPQVANTTTAVPQLTKTSNKKRNKTSTLQATINSSASPIINSGENFVLNSTTNVTKTNNAKDLISTSSKKDSSTKSKNMTRMDEEVINHIDDAINSVINAVKASLDNEEAQKALEMALTKSPTLPQPPIQIKTTDDVNTAKENVAEFKYLTAARRNMRSKTLDCRPPALSKAIIKSSAVNINQQQDDEAATTVTISVSTSTTTATITPSQPIFTTNNDIIKCSNNQTQINDCSTQAKISESVRVKVDSGTETNKIETQVNFSKLESTLSEENSCENSIKQKKAAGEDSNVEETLTPREIDNFTEKVVEQLSEPPTVEDTEIITIAVESHVDEITSKNIVNCAAKNTTNLDLEQMSNNNNTSSGFHSSAQSDQQTSVMSTVVAVSAVGAGNDAKKKQRRRRKNELAAIVADQLLESFKLDKARRDNLKKLENLAYEKSEDLLLTGMLLMSSTKRNVASSSFNQITTPSETADSCVVSAKPAGKTPRNNHKNEVQKQNDSSAIEKKTVVEGLPAEKLLESKKEPLDNTESADGKKNNKRRQYRRRGKTLDNENISRLKSSLESFSIDIERQLTEYEAKNLNMFKNVSANESTKQPCNSKNHTPINVNKPSIILRPSILSATLESPPNQETPQNAVKANITNDLNKTVVSSRDPRLNKNIHKEDEKNSELSTDTVNLKENLSTQKENTGLKDIEDLEEDNYLTEIAKNVNEKIMSTENEEFAFKDDGFEMANDVGMDDSNSKFSRPPTSMSIRSAPNFNDDQSNFGSICDENTNTEVMDMDLDDEMSVYTSYSQDLGRGRGRRRRRRRSILLTRKPKKRASSRDMSAEKIECILCKKVFYSTNSLTKHNMTLAHVSKVSEQEYLLSKSNSNIRILTHSDELQPYGSLGPYARISARRATISEPPMQSRSELNPSSSPLLPTQTSIVPSISPAQSPKTSTTLKSTIPNASEVQNIEHANLKQANIFEASKTTKSLQKPTTKDQILDSEYDVNISVNAAYNGNPRLNLNPDERLFFECCNILKSAETPRLNNTVNVNTTEERNINNKYPYAYNHQEKSTYSNLNVNRPPNNLPIEPSPMRTSNIQSNHQLSHTELPNINGHVIHPQHMMDQQHQSLFRDPQLVNQLSGYNKVPLHDNRNARSPTYSAISHLSAVTNTTSRFKTKAAMKGYENVNIDLNQQQESKSRTICKLTELAEIALGNEEKPNSHGFSPIQSSLTPPQVSLHVIHSNQIPKVNVENVIRPKRLETPEYASTLVTENIRECNVQLPTRSERTKNNETRSSTSSKTIMHSSIIKAAVEEHQKAQTSNKIIIPDRPFKNIGLEEKETITFQKPKAPAVNLLTEDNNSVSTGSFSDRDDYDFGSLSCDDEVSVRGSNDKNQKNNSTESSSESSRATAKTFENKSLIMGRIFKNASTKAAIKTSTLNTVKVKSVGVQKDQTPLPKADLNQLFDELRGNSGVDGIIINDRICNQNFVQINPVADIPSSVNSRPNNKQYQIQRENLKSIMPVASPPAVVSSTTATPPANVRKAKTKGLRAKSNVAAAKTRKDISKLQTELGMSPDEIQKLIDEGQRKSKRRCATNRPKKLVEMWSSDEYEEFLSTKDIIALIEEKEQQEKRKKRKSSINISSNTSEVAKDKEIMQDVTSSTKDLKRRNTRRMSIAVERSENLEQDELLPPKDTKIKKANNKKEEPVSATAINASDLVVSKKINKALPKKSKGGKKSKTAEAIENSTTLTAASDNNNVSPKKRSTKKNSSVVKAKSKQTQKTKQVSSGRESARAKSKKNQYEYENESNEEDNINEDLDDDDDDDFLISELKTKQSKTRGRKMKKSKAMAARSASTVSSTAIAKSSKPSSSIQGKKTGSSNTSNSSLNIQAGTSNQKTQLSTQSTSKGKRKNQSNQSPPRRKRLATEKLYYWSSSSDEDFGRINQDKIKDPQTANYESGAEQYQKHGWIVGDSHKKLVTLLAIAKGNKKVDSNSGVKKNIGKKRN